MHFTQSCEPCKTAFKHSSPILDSASRTRINALTANKYIVDKFAQFLNKGWQGGVIGAASQNHTSV